MAKTRLHLIDEYRGFWIVNMIVYHGIWDLVYIFGCNWQWFKSDITFFWQQWGCWSFIFISGFCWQMSKKNLKRGLEVFGAGLLITVVTLLVMPDSRVIFGVLTLLGSSMLLMIPCDVLFRKINPLLGAIVSFVLFLFVYPINDGYFGFFTMKLIALPRELYSSMLGTYLGFTQPGFWSTDYFSLFPWFFMYVIGYFTYSLIFGGEEGAGKTAVKRFMAKSICPPLGWVGRNSLIIYILHQPVVYGILMVWNFIK